MQIELIQIPVVRDHRGNLGIVEGNTIPFALKRVYYLFDVPSGAKRGGHSHIEQEELLLALSGSFDVILHDGLKQHRITLNKPDTGLLVPKQTWRELENFSSGSVCMVISSGEFDESDYIRDFDSFIESSRAQ
ncbi:sugar 3,4-ketoisomerase [Flavobacterium silvaticum]|uniref:WxcM-like domain-containing protein n=1 Tax=Flavobacterium silvaticum TaxID=1852020 RepID=A0A972FRH6_9FLAO|nr:FdtA/QdtA family cupin domain-containing protein [Flavobacterium silvaticum]NMH26662.1 WxcM-like domain-containing protein [Flavobacterium silvaticum]